MRASAGLVRLLVPVLLAGLVSGCARCSSTAGGGADRGPGLAVLAEARAPEPAQRHVHLMHLDGFRADLFEKLLDGGQLPHFAFLLERGKLSTRASTVDKSETMKVIEAYLTSRRDTYIAGWWQWSRESFQFQNYWLDPAEIINYELGLQFPTEPTVFDFLAARGRRATAGFSLHRRSVPFRDYTQNFVEGAKAVYLHTYYDQCSETMSSVRGLYERTARDPAEPIPAFSTSLLAAADESAHLLGVVSPHVPLPGRDPSEHCFSRKDTEEARAKDPYERIFRIVDEDPNGDTVMTHRRYLRGEGRFVSQPGAGHFSRVVKGVANRSVEVCFHLPRLLAHHDDSGNRGPTTVGASAVEWAEPRYALGMILVDIQVGKLVQTLRSVRFQCEGGRAHCFDGVQVRGVEQYLAEGRAEGSLFERTLLLFTGDHGMIDTRSMMAPDTEETRAYGRRPGSLPVGLIEALNADLGLATPSPERPARDGERYGIDDAIQPLELRYPHQAAHWQSPEIRRLVGEAEAWANAFFGELEQDLKASNYRRHWFVSFFSHKLVDRGVEGGLEGHRPRAVAELAKLYLRGDPTWVAAERAFLRDFFRRHVRLVYGGGAKNNAELFLPGRGPDGEPSWEVRPTFEQIREGARLLDTLKKNPGVALVFVRRRYGPDGGEILVFDRFGNEGWIRVKRDPATSELLYAYAPASARDPLGYAEPRENANAVAMPAAAGERYRTYGEWNEISVQRGHYWHNVVAGMGSYLMSDNPAIGDLTLMNAQGWNFGDNAGGHGGLHREEKLTVMIASGPGIHPGELLASARYETGDDGSLRPSTRTTYPTVVDVVPTALHWLGYGDRALTAFARDGFREQVDRWVQGQRRGYPDDFASLLDQAMVGLPADARVNPRAFGDRLRRLFRFIELQQPDLRRSGRYPEDGNLLDLSR